MRLGVHRSTRFVARCGLLAAALLGPLLAQSGGLVPGRTSEALRQPAPCVTPAERALLAQRIAEYARTQGFVTLPSANQASFAFYPQGGEPGRDLFAWFYADLDPTPGIRDFLCKPFTYDGHDACDSCIRSFAEQDIGVPIFAARDGRVIDAQDGHFDRNTAAAHQPNNYVVLDHGTGRVCSYFHMRKGSVAVQKNQWVRAGQQIGLTGSSGHSSYPHLHFSTWDGTRLVEPHAGPCNPGVPGFAWQPAWDESHRLWDCGITRDDPTAASVLPFPERPPAGGQLALADQYFHFWCTVLNQPAGAQWRTRFKRPDSTLAYESPPTPFTPADYRRWWPFYWRYDLPDLHQITGTWIFELEINGKIFATLPFAVRSSFDPGFNRAPEPILAQLDPRIPEPDRVVFCRVSIPMLVDDQDYDLVRFRYRWKVNGNVVRDVVTAAHADAIPAGTTQLGDLVECTVTAGDGKAQAAPVIATATVQASAWTDLGLAKSGSNGPPLLEGLGTMTGQDHAQWLLTAGASGTPAVLVLNVARADLPLFGGTLVPQPSGALLAGFTTDAAGAFHLILDLPPGLPKNVDTYAQAWLLDSGASFALAASNGLKGRTR